MPLSVGDLEAGDVDGDGDLDLVLADWGPGNNMTNDGGRTRLWLNDGTAHFADATDARMPRRQDPLLVGPRAGRRGQRRRSRRAGVVQALRRQQPVSQRRQRHVHGRSARSAAVHEQLRVRADGPRRRRVSRPRDDQRRRDRRRGQRAAAASTCSATTARAASATRPRPGGRRRTTSARTTTWWRSSMSTPTATPTSSSDR